MMTRLGKSLRFEEDEIQDLVGMSYGNRRVFPTLSLLYPGMDFRNEFHVDHIFPRSLLTRRRLLSTGLEPIDVDSIVTRVDQLPNLQLLEGPTNVTKTNKLPLEWLKDHYLDSTARDYYRARHDLGDIPESVHGFDQFYEARQHRIADRLRRLLSVPGLENEAARLPSDA